MPKRRYLIGYKSGVEAYGFLSGKAVRGNDERLKHLVKAFLTQKEAISFAKRHLGRITEKPTLYEVVPVKEIKV